MEKHLYVPILRDGDLRTEEGWQELLATDYDRPQYHVSYLTAVARRVRNNYPLQLIGRNSPLVAEPVSPALR